MGALIYKDFIINRNNLLILFCPILLISAMPLATLVGENAVLDEVGVLLPLLFIFAYAMIAYIISMFMSAPFEPDERKKWADFITSSPQGTTGQIGAKYYFVLILAILGLFWCTILENIYAVVFPEVQLSVGNLCITFFYIQLLTVSIEIPFVVRFGSKVGSMIKALTLILVILVVVVYALFGDLSIFGSIDSFYDWLLNLISGNSKSDILLYISAIFPYLSIALFYLSYRISCKLYLRGVEEYDK